MKNDTTANNTTATPSTNEAPLKVIDGKEVMTQDGYLEARIQEAIKAGIQEQTKLTSKNSAVLSFTVSNKKSSPGKPKLDKQGNETGGFWDDSYSVDACFQGGSIPIRCNATDYAFLQEDGTSYDCHFKIASKENDHGFMTPVLKPINFTKSLG
jgi:hypothetical protein